MARSADFSFLQICRIKFWVKSDKPAREGVGPTPVATLCYPGRRRNPNLAAHHFIRMAGGADLIITSTVIHSHQEEAIF